MPKRRLTAEDIKKLEEHAATILSEKKLERQEQSEYITKMVERKKILETEIESYIQPVIKAIKDAKDIYVIPIEQPEVTPYILRIDLNGEKYLYQLAITTRADVRPPHLPFLMELRSRKKYDKNSDNVWCSEDMGERDDPIKNGYSIEAAGMIYILDLIQKKMEQLDSNKYQKSILNVYKQKLLPYTKRKDETFLEIPTPYLTR